MNILVIPVIIGLVEVVKRLGLNTRFLPLVAVVLGVVSFYLGYAESVLNGVIFGLTAVGLFESVRTSVDK